MDIKVLNNEKEFACISYVVGDTMIDAGVMPNKPIKKLILTHCHFDHILYAKKIKEKFGAKIYASKECAQNIKNKDVTSPFLGKDFSNLKIDFIVKEGDKIDNLLVLQTPGHTDGSICLFDEKNSILFSGDTFFHNGYGRTDLPKGDEDKLIESLKRIKNIKNFHNLQIYPGH